MWLLLGFVGVLNLLTPYLTSPFFPALYVAGLYLFAWLWLRWRGIHSKHLYSLVSILLAWGFVTNLMRDHLLGPYVVVYTLAYSYELLEAWAERTWWYRAHHLGMLLACLALLCLPLESLEVYESLTKIYATFNLADSYVYASIIFYLETRDSKEPGARLKIYRVTLVSAIIQFGALVGRLAFEWPYFSRVHPVYLVADCAWTLDQIYGLGIVWSLLARL